MLAVSCPGCQKSYRLNDEYEGKKVRCKQCDKTFIATVESDKEDDPFELPIPPTSSLHRSEKTVTPAKRKIVAKDLGSDDFGTAESFDDLPSAPKKKLKPAATQDVEKKKSGSRRKRKAVSRSIPPLITATMTGSIAGLIGAAIWGGITYLTHREVGFVAWAIGGLVGISVCVAAQEMDEFIAGVLAGTISIFSILAGKMLAVVFLVNWLIQKVGMPPESSYSQIVVKVFQASFGPADAVFFILAIVTAYRLGSGNIGAVDD